MEELRLIKGSINTVDYIFFPSSKPKLLLIKTGLGGSVYGYEGKYLSIAKCFQHFGYNVLCCSTPMDVNDRVSFETAIHIAKERFGDVFPHIDIDYMWISRGAYQCIIFGNTVPQIRALLLINSPIMINFPKQIAALRGMDRHAVLVIGTAGPSFKFWPWLQSVGNPNLELIEAEGADHHFKGMDKEFFELPQKVFLSDRV